MKPDEDVTEKKEEDKDDVVIPEKEKDPNETSEYEVTWEKRPLGIEVVRGTGGLNAWVRRVLDKSIEDKISKGSYIVKVNDAKVLGESYSRILKVIARIEGKIVITFDQNPTLSPIIPMGSMVRLTGLSRETALNGCVGFIFAEMVDGRYPVKLAESGDQVGVKPKNVTLLEEAPKETKSPKGEPVEFDLSGSYELIKTMGMNKFLRAQGMSWFKTKLQFNPKLTIQITQENLHFRMTFMGPKGAITDEFIANRSTFKGRTFSTKQTASKTAVIVEKKLYITEINKQGDKKTIVFSKKDDYALILEITNPSGITMTQEFRKFVA